LAALHDLGDDVDALADLRAVLLKLQLQQVKDELRLLIESGAQSGDALLRRNQLITRQSELAAAVMGSETTASAQPDRRL
jgi:hypothetical protein